MSNDNKNLQVVDGDKLDRALTFKPIGTGDEIKLSIRIIKEIVAKPTKSGQTCNDRDALNFMMLCQSQRLNPFAGDAYLVGYDSDKGPSFSLITSHAALLKRAESCSDYEGMQSGIIFRPDKDQPIQEREGDFYCPPEIVLGGWAKVYRKGRKETYRRMSIAAMKPAYPSQFWRDGKEAAQIVKCVEADALRSTFPALMGGLFIEGEEASTVNITSEVVPAKRPELTGHTKALNAPVAEKPKTKAKEPEPAAQAPEPEQAAPPEPDPVAELAAQESAAAEAQKPPSEFKPRLGESDNLTTVRSLLHAAGKTEEQFLEFGLKNPRGAFIKEGQKLADLSDAKHQVIIKQWKELLKLMG